MLSKENRSKIEALNIRIFDYKDMVILVKKFGADGNSIPNHKTSAISIVDKNMNVLEQVFTDCPKLSIQWEANKFLVSVWDWVPGPGPGDFEINFELENDAVEFSLNYFFTENSYFTARLDYHKKKNQ